MDYELIWWCVTGAIALLGTIAFCLPWNNHYNPKGDDPYRYCPKDEEE